MIEEIVYRGNCHRCGKQLKGEAAKYESKWYCPECLAEHLMEQADIEWFEVTTPEEIAERMQEIHYEQMRGE